MKLNLPKNWTKTSLEQLLVFVIGGDWGKDPTYNDSSFELTYCIRGSEIRNWDEERGRTASLRKVKKASIETRKLQEGDILVEISGGGPEQPVGRTVLIDKAVLSFEPSVPKICTNFLRLARPSKQINSKFLNYFLKLFYNSGEIINYQGGSNNLRNLKFPDYVKIEIPLASLAEQERIVAKIEELFSELDAGLETLKTAQAQLKTYRQAVLKDAFEGKLTEDWRIKQKKLIDAQVLRKTIRAERENEAEKNGLKVVSLNEKIQVDEIKFFNIPKNWCWIEPEEISLPEKYSIGIGPFGSNLKVNDYKDEGVPLVFVKNITRNDFTLDLKFITEGKFEELIAHSVKPLDIVVTKMGDPPGDCAIYPENRPEAVITSDCLKFRVWDKFASRKFYKYCIDSVLIKKQLGLITKGVAQKKISSGRFKTLLFPLTSLEEQQRIVEEIESRLSVCDKFEEMINAGLAQSKALRQSILKKAFEGRLVPQDENDEPASVLLKRIKEEREKSLTEQKHQKTTKKTKSETMAEELKSILKLLGEKGEPINAQALWQSSVHKYKIDEFYAEVKKLVDQGKIQETDRDGKESFLALAATK